MSLGESRWDIQVCERGQHGDRRGDGAGEAVRVEGPVTLCALGTLNRPHGNRMGAHSQASLVSAVTLGRMGPANAFLDKSLITHARMRTQNPRGQVSIRGQAGQGRTNT